jgi:hypothetical protein
MSIQIVNGQRCIFFISVSGIYLEGILNVTSIANYLNFIEHQTIDG